MSFLVSETPETSVHNNKSNTRNNGKPETSVHNNKSNTRNNGKCNYCYDLQIFCHIEPICLCHTCISHNLRTVHEWVSMNCSHSVHDLQHGAKKQGPSLGHVVQNHGRFSHVIQCYVLYLLHPSHWFVEKYNQIHVCETKTETTHQHDNWFRRGII